MLELALTVFLILWIILSPFAFNFSGFVNLHPYGNPLALWARTHVYIAGIALRGVLVGVLAGLFSPHPLWACACILSASMFYDLDVGDFIMRRIPDRCQMPGCKRRGARWQENQMEDGALVCDWCSVRYYLKKQGLAE